MVLFLAYKPSDTLFDHRLTDEHDQCPPITCHFLTRALRSAHQPTRQVDPWHSKSSGAAVDRSSHRQDVHASPLRWPQVIPQEFYSSCTRTSCAGTSSSMLVSCASPVTSSVDPLRQRYQAAKRAPFSESNEAVPSSTLQFSHRLNSQFSISRQQCYGMLFSFARSAQISGE